MLDVTSLDLLHESFTFEEIALKIGGNLRRDGKKLIVNHFRDRNGAARRNQMRAPLEDQANVPKSSERKKSDEGGESGALGMEDPGGAIEKYGEAENEERGERNKKTIAVGRNAGPVRITGDKEIKSEKGGERGCAREWLPTPEKEETGDGEEKNGSPCDETVIGREKHR